MICGCCLAGSTVRCCCEDAGGAFYRIALQFSSRFGRTDPVGLLRLHTRIADDYAASARFLYGLRAHLQRAHVVYDSVAE
jgi:hypothetical protein